MQIQKGGVFAEILDQPRAWKDALQLLLKRKDELAPWLRSENFGQILFLGCGSSYGVAQAASSITQLVSGLNTIAMPSSEILYLRRPPYDSRIKTLVVALSRTGNSDDTVWAVEKLRKLHTTCKALMIGTHQEGRLGPYCEQKILLPKTLEDSLSATRSPSTLLLCTMVITAWLSGKDAFISELMRVTELFDDEKYFRLLQDQCKKLSIPKPIPVNFTFLGSGPYHGVAYDAALKMREMAAVSAEYQYTLEYRHGSHGGLMKDHMVLGLISDTLRGAELNTLAGLAPTRAPRVAILESADDQVRMRTDHVIEMRSKVSEISRVLLMYPIIQLLAFYMGMAKGKNPDKPRHLEPPITLKERPGV